MRGRLAVIATASLLVASFATPASAINNGQPDGSGHPYVGIILTAAHCVGDDSSGAFVSFESSVAIEGAYDPGDDLISGTFYGHPGWRIGAGPGLPGFDTHDVGVVILEEPVSLSKYVQLPTAGLVDELKMGTKVDIVGYGIHRVQDNGKPDQAFDGIRCHAPSRLVKSNHRASAEFIKLSANKAKGQGGTCFGDSGGPDILKSNGKDYVLAVDPYVANGVCAGVTYSNRVDLEDVLDFIDSAE